MGRTHGHAWGAADVACPYCGAACQDRAGLREHVRRECGELERDCIPANQIWRMRQEDFDRDPCYAALYEVHQGWDSSPGSASLIAVPAM